MKTIRIFSIISIILLFNACQKDKLTHLSTKNTRNEYEISSPLVFATTDDAIAAINDSRKATKSYVEPFVSYAETVMQEDDYDKREYALQSESFGSILNSKGEVYMNGYYIRLIENGYLIASPDRINEIQSIISVDVNSLKTSDENLGVISPEKLYKISDYKDVYFYDSFNITDETISTKGIGDGAYLPGYYTSVNRSQMMHGFTFPRGSDQKVTFPGHDDIANDTKIHRENNVFVSNCGVKTKTMKKGALGIWTKFACNIEAGVTDIIIEETWSQKPSIALGWHDINETSFPGGRSAIIATKHVRGTYSGISNSTVANDCANALSWAKSEGLSIESVDGVRYMYSDSPIAYIRLKNLGGNLVYEKKAVIDFDIAPLEGGIAVSNAGMIHGNNFAPAKNCLLQNCNFYGYSEYNGMTRGSRVSYNINN